MRAHTPANFTPPYEAYEARYREDHKPLACCFVGVQDRGGDVAGARSAALQMLRGPHGAQVIEQGWHDATAGARTYLYMAYWRDATQQRQWLTTGAPGQWLEQALRTPLAGHFIESVVVPPRGLDTLLADREVYWGLSKLSDQVEVTPYHAYWGGTRDRVLESASDPLLNADGHALPAPRKDAQGVGEVIDVVLPANVVVARGGPDWSRCEQDELQEFRSSVYPAYVRGGRYLAANAAEAGCYAACLVQETDERGRDLPRNHLIAYFTELSQLERWTRSHPTHLEIFGRFMAMVKKLGGRMTAMNLYHEVTVVPPGGLTAIYSNCLPETGLARFGVPRR